MRPDLINSIKGLNDTLEITDKNGIIIKKCKVSPNRIGEIGGILRIIKKEGVNSICYNSIEGEKDCTSFSYNKEKGLELRIYFHNASNLNDIKEVFRNVGVNLGRLHRISLDDLPAHLKSDKEYLKEIKDEIGVGIREVLDSKCLSTKGIDRLRDVLDKIGGLLTQDISIIHNDLSFCNVIVKPDKECCFVDLEGIRIFSIFKDFYNFLKDFGDGTMKSKVASAAFLEGYKATRSLPDDFENKLNKCSLLFCLADIGYCKINRIDKKYLSQKIKHLKSLMI